MSGIRHGVTALALCALPLMALAHHSFAMFDMSKQVSVSGTVRSVEWVSPHVWLWLTVPDAAGDVTYGFETVSPGQLLRDFGWSRHVLNVGDKIKVAYAPLRSGNPGGSLMQVTLADGSVLKTRFSSGDANGSSATPKQ